VIGLYLGTTTLASSYGAAGSVVVLLAWVSYSSQVALLGAEFTRFYVERFRGEPPPLRSATKGPRPSDLTQAPRGRATGASAP
jgi:membrane protein